MLNWLLVGIALVAAQGGFIYGLDSGIIATTFGHDSFRLYMYGPAMASTSLQGAIVSVYNAGQAIGGYSASFIADRISRRWAIAVASFLAVVGGVLQCAAMNVGMLIAGRLVGGIGCGQMLAVVPVYLAEVSPPKARGFIVGVQGFMVALGFGVANWIGYAGSFAVGDAQWRVPLGTQLPIPVVLMVCLLFMPYSPRWLAQQDRHEAARAVLSRLHKKESDDFVSQELIQITRQIQLEREQSNPSWAEALVTMFSKRYARRSFMAAFIVAMGQFSGSSVLQNFQSNFYAQVGFTGKTSLLISGVYGMMGIIGEFVYLGIVADKWSRRLTLIIGSGVLAAMLIITMSMSAVYGVKGNENEAGARAAIAFIFIYSMCYATFFNSTIWVVPSELFPFFLRAKGMAFAVFAKSTAAIVLSQITPVALANVGWRYFFLFIACNLFAGCIYHFFLPETGGKTLEEIAALFGDELATGTINEIDPQKAQVMAACIENEHVPEYSAGQDLKNQNTSGFPSNDNIQHPR